MQTHPKLTFLHHQLRFCCDGKHIGLKLPIWIKYRTFTSPIRLNSLLIIRNNKNKCICVPQRKVPVFASSLCAACANYSIFFPTSLVLCLLPAKGQNTIT